MMFLCTAPFLFFLFLGFDQALTGRGRVAIQPPSFPLLYDLLHLPVVTRCCHGGHICCQQHQAGVGLQAE